MLRSPIASSRCDTAPSPLVSIRSKNSLTCHPIDLAAIFTCEGTYRHLAHMAWRACTWHAAYSTAGNPTCWMQYNSGKVPAKAWFPRSLVHAHERRRTAASIASCDSARSSFVRSTAEIASSACQPCPRSIVL
jgi:hypothetical protein